MSAAASERQKLRTLGRAVSSVRIPRHASRRRGVAWADDRPDATPAAAPALTVWTPPAPAEAIWTPAETPTAPLPGILAENALVPLPAALLVYDDLLEWLQRLHGAGAAHGDLTAASVLVDAEGTCSLRGGGTLQGSSENWTSIADLRAATEVFVATIGGAGRSEALPLPARCLVEQAQAVENASEQLTAARLRADLAVAAGAFLDDGWDRGARTWLAMAAASAAAMAPSAAADRTEGEAEDADARRPFFFGGVTKREPRMLIGLGIAATASLGLVVGAAVGLTSSRAPAQPAANRPAVTAPAPSVKPRAATAAPAPVAPPVQPVAQPPSAAPTAAAPPTPAPAQVSHAPAPIIVGPVTFTPIAAPAPPSSAPAPPTPAPTSPCLIEIGGSCL